MPLPHDVSRLDSLLNLKSRVFGGSVAKAYERFGDGWNSDLELMLKNFDVSDQELAQWVDGYVAFAMDSMRRQKRFEKDRRYPAIDYQKVVRDVYENIPYMEECYLPGLLLSHYLWPHHFSQLRYFDSAFASQACLRSESAFIEVGVGTGIYSRRLLELNPHLVGLGLDISEASLGFAKRHVAAYGFEGQYRSSVGDVLSDFVESTGVLLCVEVLEHLEDPASFLSALRGILKTGGVGFITTALNAANVDHIYLYSTPDEVLSQLYGAGFDVEQYFVANAYAPPAYGVPVPAVAAFIVR